MSSQPGLFSGSHHGKRAKDLIAQLFLSRGVNQSLKNIFFFHLRNLWNKLFNLIFQTCMWSSQIIHNIYDTQLLRIMEWPHADWEVLKSRVSYSVKWFLTLNGWDVCLGATQQSPAAAELWRWSSVKSPRDLCRNPWRPRSRNSDTDIPPNWNANPPCTTYPSYQYQLRFYPQLCFNGEYPAKPLALMGRFTRVRVAGNQRWWKQFQKPTGIIDSPVPEAVTSPDLTQIMQR